MVRTGNSLRTQSRIAVDAVTRSSSRTSPTAGSTAAIGSAEKRIMTKPITALQKPATIHGNVTANKTSARKSGNPSPPGDSASAASHSEPAMVATNRTANNARLANMIFPAGSVSVISGQVQVAGTGYGFSFSTGWCRLALITRQAIGNSSPRLKKMAASASADIASSLWYCGPGKAEIRQELLSMPRAGEIRVKALYSAISRGTESLVFDGRVPESEFGRMRAPFMDGDFPFPVKYGYAAVGRVEDGGPLGGKNVFALHPHQTAFNIAVASLVALPDDVPPHRAVLAANMETALNGVWDAAPAPADRITIIGAGVVGSLVAYLCGRLPGASVTLVDINPARAELAAALGVDFAA